MQMVVVDLRAVSSERMIPKKSLQLATDNDSVFMITHPPTRRVNRNKGEERPSIPHYGVVEKP